MATAIGAVFCLFLHFKLLYGMQLKSSDFLFGAADFHSRIEAKDTVIVAIDDTSLEQLGHLSSWPRYYHAQLVDIIADNQARVIVFDILLSEPTPDDEELTASIKRAGNVIMPLVYTSVVHQPSLTGNLIVFENVLHPLGAFKEGAIAMGHANVIPDEDGVVRRLPLVISSGEGYDPALALSAVAKYLRRPQVIESAVADNFLPFAGRSIPLDGASNMLINYTGDSAAPLSFQTISYVDVLRNNVDPSIFQDKIVIIGATATGLGDTFWTPMGRMMSGVEIHASAVHTILSANFLKSAPASITIVSILLLTLLCGLGVLRLRILWTTLGCVILCIAYFLIAFYFFDNGIVLNMLYPPLAMVGTFVGVNLYNVTIERAEKREMTNTFGRYISPPVVNRVLVALREGELKLGGDECEVTALFADIRNFTSISEIIPPEELVRALNLYLSAIIEAVLKHNGMINKFGGDSVMAIWNVPVESEGHALLATKAALSAQRAVKKLHNGETIFPRMEFGIGINTGGAVAGNMGSENRLEYSVIGDAVNTAARLASATPGGKIWIGASTFQLVKDCIVAKPLEPLVLKGKREPIQAYEVLDNEDQED
jgi:adenylate cyclase